nr:MAG TPA: hypothetical protein [Caudoviricetes sp.]
MRNLLEWISRRSGGLPIRNTSECESKIYLCRFQRLSCSRPR